jgi:DNA-directed RNA polymerase specialized sigma24 family protein
VPTADPDEFDRFAADARARLSRAFVAAYGPDRAQDALAEALAYAWSHFEELKVMINPLGYLYRVGQSRTRPRKRPPEFPPTSTLGIPDVEPGLVEALATLTERQRICVVLIHGYEWTYKEVADLLGTSRSSVQNHLERGLCALREAIGTPHA